MKTNAQATFPAAAPAGHRRRDRKTGGAALLQRRAVRVIFSRPRLLVGAAGVIVGLILFSAGAAFAYFLLTDNANASAAAATLPAPAGVAQNGTVTSVSVPLTWSAPSGSPSYSPTGYQILRCAGDGCTSFAPVTSGGCAKVTATSCTDTDPALSPSTKYSYEVEAELDNWVSGPGYAFTASTTGPAQLAFTTQPTASIQAKGTGSFSVTVTVQDGNGTTVANDNSDQVALGLTGGTRGATLSCSGSGDISVQASSGVATFTGCSVDKAGAGYHLTATSGSLSSATSSSFGVTAGAAAQLAFTTQPPGSSRSGAGFPVALTVQDGNGNTVAADNSDSVTLGLAGGANGARLTCGSPGATAQANQGVAAFTGCSVDKADANYTLTATSGSLTSATSSTFGITGSQLAFTAQPSPGQSIQAVGTGSFAVKVAVKDSAGTTDNNDGSDQVTLGLTAGPSGAQLTCNSGTTVQANQGVAKFNGCAIDKAGTYQLTAASGSLTAAPNANSFSIAAGNATQVVAISGDNQSAPVSTDFASPLVAQVRDANGNPVLTPGTSVTFKALASPGQSATFAGCANACKVSTDGNGQATVNISANGKAGTYGITASAAGLTSGSFTETNTAKPSVTVSSLTAANGSGTAGKLDAGDSVSIVFSAAIDPGTVCPEWANGNTARTTGTVSIGGGGPGGPDNTLTFTPDSGCSGSNFGTVSLGSPKYFAPGPGGTPLTFATSTLAYDASSSTLTITLGPASTTSGGTEGIVTKSALKLTLSSGILDANDIALARYTASPASGQQF